MKDRLLHCSLHLISNGMSLLSLISLSTAAILIPVHKNSSSYHYKNVYKNGENHLSESSYSSSNLFSQFLYRSALAATSLYLFLLCADFPFYRLLHIWRRASVGECQRAAFCTQGSSWGLIYPFALCSIQWDFSKSLSLDLSKGSP